MSQDYLYESTTPVNIRDLWQTPRSIFNYMKYELGYNFTLDAAASNLNHLCSHYFTVNDNSLEQDWSSSINVNEESVWLNPPYSDIRPWIEKAHEESTKGVTTVMLVPADTSVGWFNRALELNVSEVMFVVGGRISFVRADTQVPVNGNNKGSMFLIFSPNEEPTKFTTVNRDVMINLGSDE